MASACGLRQRAFVPPVQLGEETVCGWDAGFRTFVEPVPEPSTLAVVAFGLLSIIGYEWSSLSLAMLSEKPHARLVHDLSIRTGPD